MYRLQNLDWFQRIVLILLAVMLIVFAVLYGVVTSKVGFLYRDTVFMQSKENGSTIYSGEIDGLKCVFTVTENNTVTFQCGEGLYGPFTAKEDPTAVPDGREYLQGIQLMEGDQIYYRGGIFYNGEGGIVLFNENGDVQLSIVTDGDGTVVINGKVIDQMKPSAATVLQLMYGPQLVHKGTWIGFISGLMITVMTAVSILFADELFRWKLSHRIQNAELAEPSDYELVTRYIAWSVLPIMIFGIYMLGLK